MNNNYILTLQLKCEFGFNLHKTNHILLLHVYSTISCRGVPITESVIGQFLCCTSFMVSFDCRGFYYTKLLEMTTGL